MKQRVALLVYVDLDPVPGAFHTAESAKQNVEGLMQNLARNKVADHLDHNIEIYNPIVAFAPDSLQPSNHPRNMEDSGEIPKVVLDGRDLPLAGQSTIPGLVTLETTFG